MTSELREYLEKEYADFEGRYLQGKRFWRAPVYTLKETILFSFFERFCELFPDHASEHNSLFYLVQDSSGRHSVLFVCTHFEHASLTEVRDLMSFLEQSAPSFVRDGRAESIALELLNNYSEKLHIRFYDPLPGIVALLQQHLTP
jgi:hypothetical protein